MLALAFGFFLRRSVRVTTLKSNQELSSVNGRTLDSTLATEDGGNPLAVTAIPSAFALPPAQRLRERNDWSPGERKQLIKDWNDGISSGKLAARYGRTRSSVVGMVKRLRDSGIQMRIANPHDTRDVRRANAGKRNASRTPKPATAQSALGTQLLPTATKMLPVRTCAAPQQACLLTNADEAIVRPPGKGKVLMALAPEDCRWPIGDPQRADFYFCAVPKIPGLPYCEFHARKAYQPAQPRRLGIPNSSALRAGPSIGEIKKVENDTVNG